MTVHRNITTLSLATILPLVAAVAIFGLFDPDASSAMQDAHAQTADISEIKIGALVQYTEEDDDTANLEAIKLSVHDMNTDPSISTEYKVTLETIDITHYVTSGDLAGIAGAVKNAIDEKGILYFVGPSSSVPLAPLKPLSDSETQTVFISQGSSSPVLPHPGGVIPLSVPDGIFRLVPSEVHQAAELTGLVMGENKDAVIIVVREQWAGIVNLLISGEFASRVDRPLVTYPNAESFAGDANAASASHAVIAADVNARLASLIESHGANNVAVMFIGYPLDFEYHAKAVISAGSSLQSVYDVKWYGMSAFVGVADTLRDGDVAEFAERVHLTGTKYTVEPNSVNESLCSRLLDVGVTCNAYASETFASYDAVHLLVDSVIASDDRMSDPQKEDLSVRQLVLSVARGDEPHHLEREGREIGDGALGAFEMNDAGDLESPATYTVLQAVASDTGAGSWTPVTVRACR